MHIPESASRHRGQHCAARGKIRESDAPFLHTFRSFDRSTSISTSTSTSASDSASSSTSTSTSTTERPPDYHPLVVSWQLRQHVKTWHPVVLRSACKQLELCTVTRLWTLSLRSQVVFATWPRSRLSPKALLLGSCSLWRAQWWHPLDRRGPIKPFRVSPLPPSGPGSPPGVLSEPLLDVARWADVTSPVPSGSVVNGGDHPYVHRPLGRDESSNSPSLGRVRNMERVTF